MSSNDACGYEEYGWGMISLKKGESYTDWLRRPLSKKQEQYALDDVRYLFKPFLEALPGDQPDQ